MPERGSKEPVVAARPRVPEAGRKPRAVTGPVSEPVPNQRVAARAKLHRQALNESMSFLEEALCSMEGPSLREGELGVLFLGPFALTEEVAELSRNWSRELTSGLGWPVHLVVGDPTYSEMDIECRGFWFKPHAKKTVSYTHLTLPTIYSV